MFTVVFILLCYTVFPDSIYDEGTILSWDDTNLQFHKFFQPDELGRTVEMVFVNKLSGKQIFYTGVRGDGEGIYWIKDEKTKKIISQKNSRYNPGIWWHGGDIAAITRSGNASHSEVVFYDFSYNTTAEALGPNYVIDADKHLIVYILLERIIVLDLTNSETILDIDFYKAINAEHAIDYSIFGRIRPDIKIDDNKLVLGYSFNDNGKKIEGNMIYEFNR
ncbi:hypothetical protein FACS189450_13030 [Spirochaetia bacterium]|nr:hypothetical protein FACS189450_13030 [Spirochaetia bacterium]